MPRPRRRIVEATIVAGLVAGGPSSAHAWWRGAGVRSAVAYGRDATRAIGTLVPPGRPGLIRGAIVHGAVSAVCGELLGRALPRRHSVRWGALAGLALGVVNVGVIGRRYPAIRELDLAPQLADNLAFGAIFALVADRAA